jgi:hypothetical protein
MDTHQVHEQEIIRNLLTLPKDVREHLVATYSDALAFFAQLGRISHRQSMSQAIEKQQAMYGRIANALVDSLASDPPEEGSA